MGYSAAYCIARGECNRGLSVPAPASATPADVGELVERLRAAGCHYGIPIERDCAEAATALERVTRERDEWERRAGDAIMGEAAAIERAESAEAKLAEARKVIEPFAEASREFNFAMSPDGIDDGITVIASTVVRDREATLSTSDFSAARRFLEETK